MPPIHPAEPPRLPLAQLPTPVTTLPNLSAHEKLPTIFLKRDDLTGLELSGNKIRKLEYLLADAKAKGATSIVTHGGYQSNHCRATAAAAARLGLHCRLFLRSPSPTPDNDGNLFLDHLFGADITLHPPDEYANDRQRLIDSAMDAERRAGRSPYFFPVGASIPLGSWGYIRMIHELAAQLPQSTPVDLYAPVSSSGTLAGLILGKALFNLPQWTITGIPVSDSIEYFQRDVRALIDNTIQTFTLPVTPADTPITLLPGSIGQGYAIPTPESLAAIRLLARTEGIALDPTYTAKAFAGLLTHLKHQQQQGGHTPIFIHTGGLFGLLARRDLFPSPTA